MTTLPSLFIPHGGGPCFFMEWTRGPRETWFPMRDWLAGLMDSLPARPERLLIVSAHWECDRPTVNRAERPELIFDYYGFPPHTYELEWPAPGDPALSDRVATLLEGAGLPCAVDESRGYDHGVFVPMLVAVPQADISVSVLSLHASLDPTLHMRIGAALAPLREDGVLIVGSGMSYHNMQGLMSPGEDPAAFAFDDWLTQTVEGPAAARAQALANWERAPGGRQSHPRAEHLAPIFVAAGAAHEAPGRRLFTDDLLGVRISGYAFG